MADPHVRFFVAEHPLMMFIGLCVAHGASVWAKKAQADRVKFLRSAIGFALALGLILAGIPWFRLGGEVATEQLVVTPSASPYPNKSR